MYQIIDECMKQEKFSRAATAAFTGHRFVDASLMEHVKKRLSNAVLEAYGQGIRYFLTSAVLTFRQIAISQSTHKQGVFDFLKGDFG